MWLFLWACTKAPAPLDAAVERGATLAVARRIHVEGPLSWSSVGMCLTIPLGWEGSSGTAPLLLDISEPSSGAQVRLQAWPWGTPMPQNRGGYSVVYQSDSPFRTIPLLAPASVYTLSNADGALIEGWVGTVEGRHVVLELQPAFGRAIEGRVAFEGLVSSLRNCDGVTRRSTAE